MIFKVVSRGFLVLLSFWTVAGCADEASMTINYTVDSASASTEPDLVVILSLPPGGSNSQFKQSLGPVVDDAGTKHYFYDNGDLLRKCALSQSSTFSGTTAYINTANFGGVTSGSATDCTDLAHEYFTSVFGGQTLNISSKTSEGLKLADTSNGVIFVLFFWGAVTPNTTGRCVQIFATSVNNKRLVTLDSGATQTFSGSLNLTIKNRDAGGRNATCYSLN